MFHHCSQSSPSPFTTNPRIRRSTQELAHFPGCLYNCPKAKTLNLTMKFAVLLVLPTILALPLAQPIEPSTDPATTDASSDDNADSDDVVLSPAALEILNNAKINDAKIQGTQGVTPGDDDDDDGDDTLSKRTSFLDREFE